MDSLSKQIQSEINKIESELTTIRFCQLTIESSLNKIKDISKKHQDATKGGEKEAGT